MKKNALQENQLLAKEIIDNWNNHDIDHFAEFFDEAYEGIDIGEAKTQVGRKAILQGFTKYLNAFPDLQIVTNDMIITENRIVLMWTATGTHSGPLLNIPATGKDVVVRGISVFKTANSKILHGFHLWDMAGLLRELGLLPDL